MAGAKADGGTGNNTLGAADAAWLSASIYTNFQTLDVGGGKGTYDLSTMPSLNAVVVSSDVQAAGVAIDKAAAGTTLAFNAAASTDLSVTTGAISYALKTDTTADSLSIALNAKDGNNDHTADGVVTVGDLTANKIESISIASKVLVLDADDTATVAVDRTKATDYTNTITKLSADAVKTITLTGEAKADVTLVTPALTKVDATGNTGGVTVDATDVANVKAVTFLGGAGADVYKATAYGDLMVGGAGADSFTLGAGKDTVRYTSASDSVLSLNDTTVPADGKADTITGIDSITGFSTANDKIELSSALGLATGDARTAITQLGDISGASAGGIAQDLQTVIGTGAGFFNDGSVNRAVAFAADGVTGGYLFVDVNHDGNFTAGSDLAINLVGVTALDVTSITFG